ncbi:MAG: nicotinate phosphoribosyltransferase [Thermodesulfobacteriota bacterium]|nr:nicotinate phosphoribosyltransferase [Thermodesulfobacteriota bacterium]
MNPFTDQTALFTDFYELTMCQGYFLAGRAEDSAVFDYFFRANPFDGGYVVYAGLDDLLNALNGFVFSGDALAFLREQGFAEDFLDYLKDFRFNGAIASVPEGEVVFPIEPVLRVDGTIMECQLIETLLLNCLNFESLIATKAARIRRASGDRIVADFGLRRAQGPGGLLASRAAVIGGVDMTSNVLAGQQYGIPLTGTQAHSWVQSLDDELAAFRQYADAYPDNTVLLVDTVDTLKSGVPNAIIVGQELAQKGYSLKAIRLDSGDLAYLSKKARKMLDEAGFHDTKILVSNQLDEFLIRSILEQSAPVDGFGVGTELITGKKTAALDGVYKLSVYNGQPKLKLSDNPEKTTLPGKKQVCRFYDEDGTFYGDCIALSTESELAIMHHPHEKEKHCRLSGRRNEPLMQTVMENGRIVKQESNVSTIQAYCKQRLNALPEEHRRFEMPHIYKVGISDELDVLRNDMRRQLLAAFNTGE